jgi:hypothetical protein
LENQRRDKKNRQKPQQAKQVDLSRRKDGIFFCFSVQNNAEDTGKKKTKNKQPKGIL